MYKPWGSDPRERFDDQFDWDGADAIYRGNRIGPAYRVTADEYHSFLDDYDRNSRLIDRLRIAAAVLTFALLISVPALSAVFLGSPTGKLLPLVFWVPIVIASLVASRWLALAPERVLRSRMPIAPALSGDDRLARTIGEKSWESLVAEAVAFCLMALAIVLLGRLQQGPSLVDGFFLLTIAGFLTHTMVQMVRKWAFERRRRVADRLAGIAS